MSSGPKPLKSLLHAVDAELGSIVRHAEHLRRVRAVVLTALPAQAGSHIHVAAVDPGRMLLHVDSAGWATRLRYAEPAIRQALAQRMRLHIDNITTRVRPQLAPTPRRLVQRRISADNRSHMHQIAAYIDHPELAQSLHRLADQSAKPATTAPSQAAATGRALT